MFLGERKLPLFNLLSPDNRRIPEVNVGETNYRFTTQEKCKSHPWVKKEIKRQILPGDFADFLDEVRQQERLLDHVTIPEEGGHEKATVAIHDRYREIYDIVSSFSEEHPEVSLVDIDNKIEPYKAELFALISKMSELTLGMKHYSSQLVAGLLMSDGIDLRIKTGEGKTIISTLPIIVGALAGRGVTVATTNEYLATRDMVQMSPLYSAFGLRAAFVGESECGIYDPRSPQGWRSCSRREAYQVDITYGTLKRFAFDREQDMRVKDPSKMVRRYNQGEYLAPALIEDEMDDAEISEHNKPLIVTEAPKQRERDLPERQRKLLPDGDEKNYILLANRIVGSFELGEDVKFDQVGNNKGIVITEEGFQKADAELEVLETQNEDDGFQANMEDLQPYLHDAARAYFLYEQGVHYQVYDKSVALVDQVTNRSQPGTRFSDGLHQSLEAKHGVPILEDAEVVAKTTLAAYIDLHHKKTGTSGTIPKQMERELDSMDRYVVSMPSRILCDFVEGTRNGEEVEENQRLVLVEKTYTNDHGEVIIERFFVPQGEVTLFQTDNEHQFNEVYHERVDMQDRVFNTEEERIEEILKEVEQMSAAGRPVMIFVSSLTMAARISSALIERYPDHKVLSANPDQASQEAMIIALAGRQGAINVITGMGGRGTDYNLGLRDMTGLLSGEVQKVVIERFFPDINVVAELYGFIEEAIVEGYPEDVGENMLGNFEELAAIFSGREDVSDIDYGIFSLRALVFFYISGRDAITTFIRNQKQEAEIRFGRDFFIQSANGVLSQVSVILSRATNNINQNLGIWQGLEQERTVLESIVGKPSFATFVAGYISIHSDVSTEVLGPGAEVWNIDTDTEAQAVREAGGIHAIVCAEINQSTVGDWQRIKDQFLGRVARQREPGSARVMYNIANVNEFPPSIRVRSLLEGTRFFSKPIDVTTEEGVKRFLKYLSSLENQYSLNLARNRKELREINAYYEANRQILFKVRNFILMSSDADFVRYLDMLRGKFIIPAFEDDVVDGSTKQNHGSFDALRKSFLSKVDQLSVDFIQYFDVAVRESAPHQDHKSYLTRELHRIFNTEVDRISKEMSLEWWEYWQKAVN